MKSLHRQNEKEPLRPVGIDDTAQRVSRALSSPDGRDGGQTSIGRELLDSILRSISDGVAVADRDGNFIFFNEAAEKILGLGMAQVAPDQWSATYGCYRTDQITPYPPGELPLARALRGEPVHDEEIFVRNEIKSAGTWISVNSSPLYDKKLKILGGVVVFRDITRRRNAFAVVRRLSEAVERTADSVFITDATGIIEYVNPAFEVTTGYARDEALGRTPRILKSEHQDRGYYDKLWATILTGEVHIGTVVNRRKNGELYHAEQTITPVKDAGDNITHFVSVVKDVTELKRAKEREVEMRLAREVQQRLYPSRAPRLAGFEMAGAAFPADETCGDYFDFISLPYGCLGIAVGDVSGHGFGSALIMAQTRAYLRSLVRSNADLGETMRQLDSLLRADMDEGSFVTLLLARLDPLRKKLVYSSAGHDLGYVLDGSGSVKQVLGATGIPLGMLSAHDWPSSQEIDLDDGDLIVLMTDGLAETQDLSDAFFDHERALQAIADRRHLDARGIVDGLYEAARSFADSSPQLDDITIVVCKVLAAP